MRAIAIPAVLACGCAYVAYDHMAGPPTQLVHASPDAVYSAFSDAASDLEQGGTVEQGNGQYVAYQVIVDKVPGKSIDASWLIGGNEAGHLHLDFSAADQGATRVAGKVDFDKEKFRDAFRGHGEIYKVMPLVQEDWELRTALRTAAEKIEAGKAIASFSIQPGTPENDWSPAQQRAYSSQQMRNATKPMIDPAADARKAMGRSY
jgi:hypothetical protein